MAAIFLSAAMNFFYFLHLILLFIVFAFIPPSLSQLISPQNIQTFYPFLLPPIHPPRIPTRPRVHPPPPPPPPQPELLLPSPAPPLLLPLPPSTPSRKAVGAAIGVTAASTLVLSALFFFLVLRYLKSRKEKGGGAATSAAASAAANGGGRYGNKPAGTEDEFLRFEGNLKAVIVDEEGLDVLYWRKLEGGEGKESFNKQLFSNIESGLKDDVEKKIITRGGGRKKPGPPVQEMPMLRGKSSTSQDPVWAEDSSIELGTRFPVATPPPVPPPPAAAESPPSSVQAVPKAPSSQPSSSKQGISRYEEEQGKLNPLHLYNVDHSIDKFDGDLMEALFGTIATNRKSPRTDPTSANKTREITGPPSQIFILETRKSQEYAILLNSLGVTRKEIINALDNGVGLDTQTLENLSRVVITKEEESDILGFEGPPTQLADTESFLFYILKEFPSAFHRFKAVFIRQSYGSEIISLKASLQTLELACNELRNSRMFIKLLEAILKAGNRMGSGNLRGNGKGFKLTDIRKLCDVKSVDGKITVLYFVVQEVIRAEGKRCRFTNDDDDDDKEKQYMTLGLPVVGGMSSEFAGVKKAAAAIDYNWLSGAHSVLSSKVYEIEKFMERCREDGGAFAAEMGRFLAAAEQELKVVREEQTRVMEMVKRTTKYYQEGSSNDRTWQPLKLFIMVKDFLEMIDQACVEIARNLQKKKPTGVESSSSPSRTVRFPKLQPDFLTEQIDSSSDSIEDS